MVGASRSPSEAAINAVWIEVWSGAFREAIEGHVLPPNAVSPGRTSCSGSSRRFDRGRS
jgi:hypothetical protein